MVKNNSLVPYETIEHKIFLIRGKKVMLDRDLAHLYGIETKRLKERVNRNIRRFPKDFMFTLNAKEHRNLRTQFATSSWGGIRYAPMAFTDLGVSMLSSVLNSERAIEINIQIMRTFNRLSQMISSHEKLKRYIKDLEQKYNKRLDENENSIHAIFQTLNQLLDDKSKSPSKIGFLRD